LPYNKKKNKTHSNAGNGNEKPQLSPKEANDPTRKQKKTARGVDHFMMILRRRAAKKR